MKRLSSGSLLILVITSAIIGLSGCSNDPVPLGTPAPPEVVTSPTPAPAPTPAPTPSDRPAGVVPDVPVYDASLGAQPVSTVSPPVRVVVPAVQIDMSVAPMGVDDQGLMELPNDSNIAGWYEYGPAPADPRGTTVIAAHVDSLEFGLGQFVRLRDIIAGETISLTTADDVVHSYTVSQIVRTPKTDVALNELFDRNGSPRLVLVTCGGVFNTDTGHYLDNVIVTGIPAP